MIDPLDVPEPLAPITELDPVVIIGWYVVFYILSAFISGTATVVYQRFKNDMVMEEHRDLSLKSVVFAGPVEEIIFRGLPATLALYFDWNIVLVLLLANGFWAGMHYFAFGAFIYTFVLGLFLTRFWYFGFEGLWWVAVLIHSVHNFFSWAGGERMSDEQELDPRRDSTPDDISGESEWL